MEMDFENLKTSLYEIKENANAVSNYMDEVIDFIKKNKKDYNNGLDVLRLKNYLFSEYLSNLSYIILKKISGKNIENEPAIKRTIANRVYLEKMRILENLLNDTIDKHLKRSALTQGTINNPLKNALSLKPNLNNMIDNDDEQEESDPSKNDDVELNSEQTTTETGIYIPPKMMAVPYQGFDEDPDYGSTGRKNKKTQRSRKDALKFGLLDELRNQYGDRPEEFRESTNVAKKAIQKEIEHRIAYEEEHMVRVNLSKKDKHKMKLLRDAGSHALDDITDFRGFGDVMIQAAEEENYKAKSHYHKRGKGKFGKGGAGKGKRTSKKKLGKF